MTPEQEAAFARGETVRVPVNMSEYEWLPMYITLVASWWFDAWYDQDIIRIADCARRWIALREQGHVA